MQKQKRVAAIHDISGFGKCSLTVALPIISAAGIEVSAIPTAVLSTHTGGFTGFTYRDLTGDMPAFAGHWQSLGIKFDAIYTGFLGSFEQIEIVCDIFDMLKSPDTLIFVDPVMADNGKLYGMFPDDFPQGMAKVCKKAGIIAPNLTEAALLLGEEYREPPYEKGYIEGLLRRLSSVAPKIVLTGVAFDEEHLGAACYDSGTDTVEYAFNTKIPGYYHGTGDVFGSAFLAAYMKGFGLERSAKIAVDFTHGGIARTAAAKTDIRFGVNFEEGFPGFMRDLGIIN